MEIEGNNFLNTIIEHPEDIQNVQDIGFPQRIN